MPRHFLFCLVTAGSTLMAACGGGDSSPAPAPAPPPAPAPALVERDVLPVATDPTISTDLEAHFAINPAPAVTARGQLFVFFPGTFATPSLYRRVVRTGAAQGFHALGLNYPNSQAVSSLCNNSADVDCHGSVRREILTGQDLSSLIAVSPANSINNRLIKLLTYLHAQNPTEGWGQYLVAGQPNWTRIRVAGHSQGGGHAGYIAKLYAVDRAVYFSSPGDWRNGASQPATWIVTPGATTAARQYGFTHVQDPLVPLAIATSVWQALGLSGPPTTVDGASAPYMGSHQLTTNAAPNQAGSGGSPFHGAPVVDSQVPLTPSGAPLFEPVWIQQCFG